MISSMFTRVSRSSVAAFWLTLLVAGNAQAATGTWVTMTPMPTARAYTTSGAIGSKLYVVTGSLTTANEVYDPTTDSWTTKAPIPTDRAGASTGVIAGKVYVVGGCITSDCRIGFTNTLEMYDPGSNTWVGKTAMPTSRSFATAGVIAGKLYVTGGFQQCGPCTGLNTLEVYDPSTDAWATKASMPTARTGVGAGVVDGILYAVSGYDGTGLLNTVEAYDPVANAWATVAPIPTTRANAQPQGISGALYVAGNGNGVGGATGSALEVFVPPPIQIAIDIRPGTSLNNISLSRDRNIPIAMLSSATFDAPARADRTSLTFGRTGSEASFTSCDSALTDVNGDGRLDLVCHFTIKLSGFQMGDTAGVLMGRTIGGTQIRGTDLVRIIQ